MKKEDFTYDPEFENYIAHINGIEIMISKDDMSEEILSLANAIVTLYPTKIDDIVEFLVKEKFIEECFGVHSNEEIARKLREPRIRVNPLFGMVDYCNQEFDDIHVISVEFIGVFERFFYPSLDG
jgi:hypothetical protein